MAELIRNEPGRVGVETVKSAVTPQVQVPSYDASIALREQARMQSVQGHVLDRLTTQIFGMAEKESIRAGLQFAATNPLTREQLDAMVKGDMSGVALGSPLNVYNSALRKARAFELSAHAETEGQAKMLDLYRKAEQGQLDFEGVKNGVTALMDGYGSALAQVDAEASYKYRASMSNVGNKIINEVSALEQKKMMIANGIKVERAYQDFLKTAEMYTSGNMPIDEKTGQPFDKQTVVDMLATNFLNNAITLIGVNGASQYQAKVLKDLTDVKVNALTKYIAEEFSLDPQAFAKLKTGDAGKLTDVWVTLGEDAKAKVFQSYFQKISTDNNIREQTDKANKTERELAAIDLYKKIQATSNPTAKRELIKQMSELRVLPFDDLKKLALPQGDPSGEGGMAYFNALDAIYDGSINNSDQIRKLNLPPGAKVKLLQKLHTERNQEESELNKGIRKLSGIPDGPVVLDPKGAEFRRYRTLEADATQMKADAIREGKPLTSAQIVSRLSDNVEKRKNSEEAKAARSSLKAYEDKVDGKPITSANIDAFEAKVKAGKVPGVKENQLPRIRSLVTKAEGE